MVLFNEKTLFLSTSQSYRLSLAGCDTTNAFESGMGHSSLILLMSSGPMYSRKNAQQIYPKFWANFQDSFYSTGLDGSYSESDPVSVFDVSDSEDDENSP